MVDQIPYKNFLIPRQLREQLYLNRDMEDIVRGFVLTELNGDDCELSLSQLHRVITVIDLLWSYSGSTALNEVPPSIEYSNVVPEGQDVKGAEMDPPEGVSPKAEHVLSESTTTAGAIADKSGHNGQEPGLVDTDVIGDVIAGSESQLHLVNTVIEVV